MNSTVLWLRERFQWMGRYSGYDQLCEVLTGMNPERFSSVWRNAEQSIPPGIRRVLWEISRKTCATRNPRYTLQSAAAELGVLWKIFRQKPKIVHLTYAQNQFGLLSTWKPHPPIKLIGTVHPPLGWWRSIHAYPEDLAALDALIVLGSKEKLYFERYLPGRVYFIPHGVDTQFFRPAEQPDSPSKSPDGYPHCVFTGKWMRDIHTLAHIVDRVLVSNPKVRFDMVVPLDIRNDIAFHRIARHDQVNWHAGISDEQLRHLYQQASVLLLPLLDCTANNALLEALACGLPVITNDVGAVHDYTQPAFADIFPVGDVERMSAAVMRLIDDTEEQNRRSSAARTFTEQFLDWKDIAIRTKELYDHLLSS